MHKTFLSLVSALLTATLALALKPMPEYLPKEATSEDVTYIVIDRL